MTAGIGPRLSFCRRFFCLRAVLLFGVGLFSGCSLFLRQPPLPRHAGIDVTDAADEKFAALVENADIIYFPSESVATAGRAGTAWKLLETLQRNGGLFALGWDLIGPAGDADNGLLREARRVGAHILALRCPPEITAAMSSDAAGISQSFEPPPRDFENFARRPSAHGMSEAKLRAAYEAALLAEEFAAARIAGHFREHPDQKILVFVRGDQLGRNHGVPYFVAQKTRARQLVLDSQPHPSSRSRLMAWDGSLLRQPRRLEVVDGAPLAAGDKL